MNSSSSRRVASTDFLPSFSQVHSALLPLLALPNIHTIIRTSVPGQVSCSSYAQPLEKSLSESRSFLFLRFSRRLTFDGSYSPSYGLVKKLARMGSRLLFVQLPSSNRVRVPRGERRWSSLAHGRRASRDDASGREERSGSRLLAL